MKRRKSEIVDKTENKLLVIFKSHDGNAMMMMIERKTCERRFNKYDVAIVADGIEYN